MSLLSSIVTLIGGWTCSDVMVGGGFFPPCIIILWSEFVFWGCILYLRVTVVIFDFWTTIFISGFHAKTRLTSRVQFFQLIFNAKYLLRGFCKYTKSLFWVAWIHVWGWGNMVCGGLGPPPPHPPPIARRLFIGFQNLPQPKSHFQRPKLKFKWPFCYKKYVSQQNYVFKIKLPLL